jgi:hypothetical protein
MTTPTPTYECFRVNSGDINAEQQAIVRATALRLDGCVGLHVGDSCAIEYRYPMGEAPDFLRPFLDHTLPLN